MLSAQKLQLMGKIINFLTIPKVYVFHKEVHTSYRTAAKETKAKAEIKEKPAVTEAPEERIKKLESLLSKTAAKERETAAKFKE